MVRHDAEILVTANCSIHGKHKDIVSASLLDAHLAVEAVTHGKVSGMDSGVRYKYRIKLVNPKRDILKNGQLCPCLDCVRGTKNV